MDKHLRLQYAAQLKQIAELLSSDSGADMNVTILETCASLIGMVETSAPAGDMTPEQLDEYMFAYQLIYRRLKPFMTGAAERIPLELSMKTLMETQSLYEEQTKRYEESLAEQKRLLNEIQVCREETEAVYSTHDPLFREYEKAAAELERLRQLVTEYDPERLPELSASVDALTTETDCLRERYEVLNAQTAECLGELERILGEMSPTVGRYKERAEQIRKDAADLEVSIKVADEVRVKYRDWFESAVTPLEQLEKALGEREMSALRGALDADTLAKKNSLVRSIRDGLDKLDRIVSTCMRAAQTDYEDVCRRAGK